MSHFTFDKIIRKKCIYFFCHGCVCFFWIVYVRDVLELRVELLRINSVINFFFKKESIFHSFGYAHLKKYE
jgi:hypothetical protein